MVVNPFLNFYSLNITLAKVPGALNERVKTTPLGEEA
jgi:hypothetical protein